MKQVQRYQFVDVLRGVAILLMVIYHFCFDLGYFQFVDFDFYNDSFWLNFRSIILSMFLGLVGVSLCLANNKGIKPEKVLQRVAIIAANAVLVSVVTWYMFSERLVLFGVLHFIVVASLLGLLFIRFHWFNLIAGIAVILLACYQNSWFDQPWHQWLGMMTHKPMTEDYVPLIPWFGVILIGIFIAPYIAGISRMKAFSGRKLEPVAFLGRHSLLIYMLHQPVLMGVLYTVRDLGQYV